MSDLKVEFRAQRTLLQALHDTQQEHGATLREHGVMLTEHGAMLSEQGATLRAHGAQLSKLQVGQQQILAGVDAIREMLDRTLNRGSE